ADLSDRSVHARQPRLGGRALPELPQHLEAPVEPDVMGRAEWAAHKGEHGAVGAHECQIGLGVATVDRDHDVGHETVSASMLSASASTIAVCPMSGCASSALRAVVRSRITAASAASRSYAATCWTRPSSSGAS